MWCQETDLSCISPLLWLLDSKDNKSATKGYIYRARNSKKGGKPLQIVSLRLSLNKEGRVDGEKVKLLWALWIKAGSKLSVFLKRALSSGSESFGLAPLHLSSTAYYIIFLDKTIMHWVQTASFDSFMCVLTYPTWQKWPPSLYYYTSVDAIPKHKNNGHLSLLSHCNNLLNFTFCWHQLGCAGYYLLITNSHIALQP